MLMELIIKNEAVICSRIFFSSTMTHFGESTVRIRSKYLRGLSAGKEKTTKYDKEILSYSHLYPTLYN